MAKTERVIPKPPSAAVGERAIPSPPSSLKKKEETEPSLASTSGLDGSTSGLEGSTSGVSLEGIKPVPVALPESLINDPEFQEAMSFQRKDVPPSVIPEAKTQKELDTEAKRIHKIENIMRKRALVDPNFLDTEGLDNLVGDKISKITGDPLMGDKAMESVAALRRERDVLSTSNQESLDVSLDPSTPQFINQIREANAERNKQDLIAAGKTEEDAESISKMLFPEKEVVKSMEYGVNINKVKNDYRSYLEKVDPEKINDIKASVVVGNFKGERAMSFMQDALSHQADVIDAKVSILLSNGTDNLTEENIQQIEALESQRSRLSDRYNGLILDHPELIKKATEEKLSQQRVDESYKQAKANALLPNFNGEKARAEVLYHQVVSPVLGAAVGLVENMSQFAVNQARGLSDDEIIKGTAGMMGDWVNNFFDTEKSSSIYKKPSILKGALFEDDTPVSEGGFKIEKLVPKVSETLFQMYALLGGGGAAGTAIESVGLGANVSQKIGLITSSYVLTQNDYFEEAKALGLSDNEANNFGNAASLLTSGLELINPQAHIFGKEGKKIFTKKIVDAIKGGVDMKTAIKQNAGFVVKEIIGENAQEFAQEAGDLGVKYLFNRKNENETFDVSVSQNELKELVLLTTIVAGGGSAHGVRSKSGLEKESLFSAAKDIGKFKKFLERPEIQKDFTTQQLTDVSEKVSEYKKVVDGLPKNLDENKSIELAHLIYNKKKLTESKKDVHVDEIVAEKGGDNIINQIEEINGQIAMVFDGQKETNLDSPLPNLSLKTEGDIEYKIGDQFFSESEIIGKLNDEGFTKAVKDGKTELSISNPSPEVSKALSNSGTLSNDQLQSIKIEEEVEEGGAKTPVLEKPKTKVAAAKEPLAKEVKVKKEASEAIAIPQEKIDKVTKLEFPEDVVSKLTEGQIDTVIKDGIKFTEDLDVKSIKEPVIGKAKIAEGFDELLTSIGGKANIAPNMFNKPSSFNALKKISEGIIEETGLQGQKLIDELKVRLKEALGDKFQESDIDEVSGEITEFAKTIKKTEEAPKKPEVKKEAPKKANEVEEAKTEGAKIKGKVSKTIQRVSVKELDPEEKTKLKKIGEYDPLNVKEYSDAIRKIVDMLGVDGAIDYAHSLSDSLSDGSITKKKQILMTAGSIKKVDAQKKKNKAVKDGDLVAKAKAEDEMEIAYSVIAEAALIGTQAGQLNAIDAELHKRFPSLYMINALNKLSNPESLTEASTFKDEKGKSIPVEQAIADLRENIGNELRKEIEQELGSRIDNLEKKIEELKSEKPKSDKAKKKEIRKSINSKWDKFKKAGRGEATASLIGLNNSQIEILGSIVLDYVKLGGVSTKSIIEKVTREAKRVVSGITKDHIENIARTVNEFNEKIASENIEALKKAKEGALTEKEKKDLLDKGEELTGKKIKDVVFDHYIKRRSVAKTLTQSLIDEAGMDMDSAKELAGPIEEILLGKIEEVTKKELDKFLKSTDKDSTTDQITKKKVNKKLIDKVVGAINLGALSNGDVFIKAFEDKFGFRKIDPQSKSKMNSIIEELTLMENSNITEVDVGGEKVKINTTKREEILSLQREFNTLLDASTPLNYASILKEINGAIYISILSDPTSTGYKALIGSIGGAAFGVASETLKNPLASFLGIVETSKATGISFRRAQTAFKSGIVEVGKTKVMGEFSTDKQGRLEKALFKGVRESLKNKKYKDAIIAAYGKTLKNIRILAAMDAFLVSQTGVYYNTISEGKTKSKKGSLDNRMKEDYMKVVYNDIAKTDFDNIKSGIEAEVDFDIKRGIVKESKRDAEIKNRLSTKIGAPSYVNQKSFYTSKRAQEIRENENYETFQKAWSMGQYFSLVGRPDGYIGMATSKAQQILQINQNDSNAVATASFAGNMLFKFVNLMGNFYNATASSIPVLGIANAIFGAGYNPVTGEYDTDFIKGKWNSNKQLLYTRLVSNAIITTATLAILADQLKWDDDDEEWVINPDRSVDFRGSGYPGVGGYGKNLRAIENYEPFTFSTTKDKDGNFINYKNTNQFIPQGNAIVATIATITDDLKGMAKEKDIDRRRRNPISGYGLRLLDENLKGFLEGSFNSIGRAVKPFLYAETAIEGAGNFMVNTLADNMSPLFKPNAHIAVSKYIKSAIGAPKKKAKGVPERMVQNLYGIGSLVLDDKTDAFGNPYPETNDIQRFITEVPKMSELYPKTAGLLFKFEERGVNISKWRATEMKAYSDGFSFGGEKYRVYDDAIKDEAVKIEEEQFNKYIADNYKYLNSIESIEYLESEMKAYQQDAKYDAKDVLLNKYLDVNNKNAKIVRLP